MTLSSAYIELFVRGKSPGEYLGGNVRIPLEASTEWGSKCDTGTFETEFVFLLMYII